MEGEWSWQMIIVNFIYSLIWETNGPVVKNTPSIILFFFMNSYSAYAGLGARR